MKFEKVQCLLRVDQAGSITTLSVSKSGPDALSVTEIPLLRAANDIQGGGDDDCCITMAQVVGDYDSTGANELHRLRRKYGSKRVDAIYPGGRGLPKSIADCELPDTAIASKKRAAPKKD